MKSEHKAAIQDVFDALYSWQNVLRNNLSRKVKPSMGDLNEIEEGMNISVSKLAYLMEDENRKAKKKIFKLPKFPKMTTSSNKPPPNCRCPNCPNCGGEREWEGEFVKCYSCGLLSAETA